jgi:hypothetical protein
LFKSELEKGITSQNEFLTLIYEGGNVIYATENQEKVSGTNKRDLIIGSTGDNKIYTGNGDNIIIAGKGNDYIEGGRGKNLYYWNILDGNDIINDYANGKDAAGQSGVLRIGEGVNPANIEITRSGNNLILIISETGERLTIQNWYVKADYQLGRIEFADGNVWDRSSGQSIEAYFQELAESASQQSSSGAEGAMFAMATMFSFGYTHSEPDTNTGNETIQDKQLIVDIAIAELQMESDSGMVCNNASIIVSDSQNCFATPSFGVNPTEEYKNAV